MNHHVLHREGKQTTVFWTQNLQSIVLVLLLEANELTMWIIRLLPDWKHYNYETFTEIDVLVIHFTAILWSYPMDYGEYCI